MTPGIVVNATCERCGDSLVCSGLTTVNGRHLVVIHGCPTCTKTANASAHDSTRGGDLAGERRPGQLHGMR